MNLLHRLLICFLCFASSYTAPDALRYIERDEKGKYSGLTSEAKDLIKNSRDVLRKRKELFDGAFKGFGPIFHAAHINRLAKGNMFLYGPPGGAKSKFVRWMLDHEKTKAFELQLHQMMTEAAFVGGQNFEAMQKGRFEVETKGSLADFEVAYIDEIHNGSPSVLASLLSLLNERKVLAGNKVIDSKLQTFFSTSNANLYEFHQQFIENGLRSTAPALLNRFTTISFVLNWLDEKEQEELDMRHSDALDAFFFGSALNSDDKNALILDWDALRELALCLFKPTGDFYKASRSLLNELRASTISAQEHNEHGALPYLPTAEYTERLRQRIHEIVVMSLLIDLLQSGLTDDIDSLEQSLKVAPHNRFAVGPLSLWRAHNTLTTVTFGDVHLSKPDEHNGLDLNFSNEQTLETYQSRDEREASTIQHILKEQDRFKYSFLACIKEYYEKALQDSDNYERFQDIERLLLSLRK